MNDHDAFAAVVGPTSGRAVRQVAAVVPTATINGVRRDDGRYLEK